jgi:two-component system nitrate/nitrite response regulator NarL
VASTYSGAPKSAARDAFLARFGQRPIDLPIVGGPGATVIKVVITVRRLLLQHGLPGSDGSFNSIPHPIAGRSLIQTACYPRYLMRWPFGLGRRPLVVSLQSDRCGATMGDKSTTDQHRRVLIADPQPIFRLGFMALVASAHPKWDVAESATLDDHRTQLVSGIFDLLVLEGSLLGGEFMHDAPIRGRVNLAAGIVAVTQPGDSIGALGCLAAGAHATISRTDSAIRMLSTIETVSVSREKHPVPPIADPASANTSPAETTEILNLTNRQIDVLRLLALGSSNKVIARDLGLSVSTVKVHLNTVFRALGARNRVEAVVRARPFQARMLRDVQ